VWTVSGWAENLGARGLEETHLRYARTFGLGTWDNPVFPGMHQASALVTGATLAAARAVWSGPHDLAGGRWLLTGGGGSDLVQVVPRTWTHLLAEAAGQPVNLVAQTPDRWREYVARYTGLTAPEHMTKGHQRSSRSSPAATLLTRSTGPSWPPATPFPPARTDAL
jgi:acetoin utilization deacetylase AcuC-like enzyme